MCDEWLGSGTSNPAAGGDAPSPVGSTQLRAPAPEMQYHLHLDADRDGLVDDDRTGLDTWEWGEDRKGAIVLVNNETTEVVPGAAVR